MEYSQAFAQVREASELRAGMTVLIRKCRICGRDHAHVLLAHLHRWDWATRGFYHRPAEDPGDDRIHPVLRVQPAIVEGRMYRVEPGSGQELRILDEVGV